MNKISSVIPFVCVSGRFGRRTISLISSFGFLVSAVCVAFVNHYSLFLTFRFFIAAFGSGVFLPNFVIRKPSCARWRGVDAVTEERGIRLWRDGGWVETVMKLERCVCVCVVWWGWGWGGERNAVREVLNGGEKVVRALTFLFDILLGKKRAWEDLWGGVW